MVCVNRKLRRVLTSGCRAGNPKLYSHVPAQLSPLSMVEGAVLLVRESINRKNDFGDFILRLGKKLRSVTLNLQHHLTFPPTTVRSGILRSSCTTWWPTWSSTNTLSPGVRSLGSSRGRKATFRRSWSSASRLSWSATPLTSPSCRITKSE